MPSTSCMRSFPTRGTLGPSHSPTHWSFPHMGDHGLIPTVYPEMGLDTKSSFSIFCILRRENGNEDESVFFFLISKDESVLVVQLNGNGKVIWYNLMGRPFKKVLDLVPTASSGDANIDENGRANRFGWFNAYQYIESAAPV